MAWLIRDLTDGVKHLARHPAYSLLGAGTLALGLAAGTAVFTYVNAYNRPFPGADVDGVYELFQSSEAVAFGPLSYPDFLDVREALGSQAEVEATGQSHFGASVRREDFTEVVFGQSVTGGFFQALGVEMSLGRGLSPGDDRAEAPPAVVISHDYWIRRYGGDPGTLGRTILLNNRPYTIVGVAGASFLGTSSARRPQVFMPLEQYKIVYWARSDTETNREVGAVAPYLRVGSGMEPGVLEDMLGSLAADLDREAPLADRTRRFLLRPATWIHPAVRDAELPTTRIMLLAAAGLLLLACANVANLLLSVGARRGEELALRAAVGASRGRLVRQMLAENLILALVAGVAAFALAGPAADRISSYFASPSVWGLNVPREIHVDARVFTFAFLAAVATGLLTGLLPALRASTRDPAQALKASGRWSAPGGGTHGRWPLGARDLLVSAQVALSVVLLFVAGLVLRTLESAQKLDPGFNVERTLASYVSTSSIGTPVEEREAFFRELARRFEELPWVDAATVAEQAPLSGHPAQDLRADGVERPINSTIARVVPGYFEDMEMEILRGRSFLPTDTADDQGVVVVNETLAGRLGGEEEAVGTTLWLPTEPDAPEREFEVVGVVKNARQTTLLEVPEPVAYFSFPQHYYAPGNALILKVNGDPFAAVPRMEEELRAVDPRIAIVNILPYSEVVSGFLYTQRMNAELFSIVALLGLILAGAGVFGVVSLAVAQRRREIGIRMAMGASAGEIARAAAGRALVAASLGLGVGLAGAALSTRWVGSLIWGISPADPPAILMGMSLLAGAVVLAVALPIRRALRIDPVNSLRTE